MRLFGIVYKATNKVNGKSYIGQTVQSLSQRKASHKCNAKNGIQCYFYNAIRKYGFDLFDWEVLIKCYNSKNLNESEKLFITKFNSINDGYNLTSGGDSKYHNFGASKWWKQNNPMYDPKIVRKVIKNRPDRTGMKYEEIYNDIDIVKRVKKAASERMKKNNPMHDPEIVKKVTETRRKKGNYGKRKNNKKEN